MNRNHRLLAGLLGTLTLTVAQAAQAQPTGWTDGAGITVQETSGVDLTRC